MIYDKRSLLSKRVNTKWKGHHKLTYEYIQAHARSKLSSPLPSRPKNKYTPTECRYP